MPKKNWAAIGFLIAGILFSAALSDREPVATINFPLNRVFVIPAGSSSMKYAQFNMQIFPGDKIETKGSSRCELMLLNSDIIRLDENTVFSVEKIDNHLSDSRIMSSLSAGKLWFGTGRDTLKEGVFYLKTPSAIIAASGTVFRVHLLENSTTESIVDDGEIWVAAYLPGMQIPALPVSPEIEEQTTVTDTLENEATAVIENRWQPVHSGQKIIVHPDGALETNRYEAPEGQHNDWIEWNRRRDIILKQTLH